MGFHPPLAENFHGLPHAQGEHTSRSRRLGKKEKKKKNRKQRGGEEAQRRQRFSVLPSILSSHPPSPRTKFTTPGPQVPSNPSNPRVLVTQKAKHNSHQQKQQVEVSDNKKPHLVSPISSFCPSKHFFFAFSVALASDARATAGNGAAHRPWFHHRAPGRGPRRLSEEPPGPTTCWPGEAGAGCTSSPSPASPSACSWPSWGAACCRAVSVCHVPRLLQSVSERRLFFF